MKLYTYIVATDTGFAPNPFHGFLTHACCKARIQKAIGRELNKTKNGNHSEKEENWIVGLSPRDRGRGNKIIYIMKVEKAVLFDDYFKTKMYGCKKPNVESGSLIDRCGDNIYQPLGHGKHIQLPSMHSLDPKKGDWREDKDQMTEDLGGEYVLISRHFFYFGSKPLDLPPNLQELIVGRNYRCNFKNEHEVHAKFMNFVHGC